jgi:phenylacetate-CoA ligase
MNGRGDGFMDLNALAIRKVLFPILRIVKGNQTLSYIRQFQKTQYLPEEDLAALQREKLRRLLLHCVDHVPAYQPYKHLIPLIEKDPMEALKQFPVLTKQTVNENQEQLISVVADRSKLIPNRSGGSTGQPVRFYIDRPTAEGSESARWRALSWWDISIGDKCLMVWGNPLELSQHKKILYHMKERFLKNTVFVSAYDLSPEALQKYVGVLNRSKPKYFYGYASALYLFAQYILKHEIQIKHPPNAIVSTSETLHDYQRAAIEKAFRTRVINEYGARDAGIIAYECPQGRMHLSCENMIVEIVDIATKKPVETGKSGLVVITDLNNFSMPRLRYQIGDIAALSGEKCPCGRTLPVLDKIEGREDDIFIAENGSYVHGVYFANLARSYPSIQQFQIIQHTREDITLKVIKSNLFKESEMQQYIREIQNTMGKVNIKLEYVDHIEASASGKTRYSKREFAIGE